MDVHGCILPPELRDLDSLSSVRAFFQGSLIRADLATAVGYPVQGSGSEATVETVRAALKKKPSTRSLTLLTVRAPCSSAPQVSAAAALLVCTAIYTPLLLVAVHAARQRAPLLLNF
jgi:hypothetical protein